MDYLPARCMSTQHPDNVSIPFFADSIKMSGEAEVKEAYYAFSHLGCQEQMWDCEGKEVDNYVIKKLLTQHKSFFTDNKIGRSVFLTLRVPNPTVEKAEAKILIETLESIPRSYDTAHIFYGGEDIPPIFEVILPMTSSWRCINRVDSFYRDFVVGRADIKFKNDDKSVREWIGDFYPRNIRVIPLFEDRASMMAAHTMTEQFLKDKPYETQRVFLAHSDTAMNYGKVSAVLLNKMALYNLEQLSDKLGVKMYPILGLGSAPFRGNLRPDNVENILAEYPSTQTFSIQSAFKYDFENSQVVKAIQTINETPVGSALSFDHDRANELIDRYSVVFQNQIRQLAVAINEVSTCIPKRRRRKLHTGLFQYGRRLEGDGKVELPRAITFTASLYSLGVPPEILAFDALTTDDIAFLKDSYVNFEKDMLDSLRFCDIDSPYLPESVRQAVRPYYDKVEVDKEHVAHTKQVCQSLEKQKTLVPDAVVSAAYQRHFLG